MLHDAAVEIVQQLADGLVEFSQTEKGAIAQPGNNPAFHHLHPHFHFGFVTRFSHPGWDDCHAVMLGHLQVCLVDVRIIPARAFHALFQIIRHNDLCGSAEKSQRPHMTADPVGQLLAGLRLGVGVAAGSLNSHKNLGLPHFSSFRVGDGDRVSGIIHEQLLPRFVVLSHRWIQFLHVPPVQIAVLAVAVAARMILPVFLPQQSQGDAALLEFFSHLLPVGPWSGKSFGCLDLLREKQPVQPILVQALRQWPCQTGLLCSHQVFADRAVRHAAAPSNRSVGQSARPFQPQYFCDFSHG